MDFKQNAINQSIDRSEIRMLLSTFYEEITQYKKIAKFNTLFQNKYQLFIGKLKQKHQVINMIHCAIITHGRAYERKDEIAQNVSRMVYVQDQTVYRHN